MRLAPLLLIGVVVAKKRLGRKEGSTEPAKKKKIRYCNKYDKTGQIEYKPYAANPEKTCYCFHGWKILKGKKAKGREPNRCEQPNGRLVKSKNCLKFDTEEEYNVGHYDRSPSQCLYKAWMKALDCSANTNFKQKKMKSYIPPGDIEHLDMSENHITEIPSLQLLGGGGSDIAPMYEGLPNLKSVSFKNCYIREIPDNVFKSSVNLEIVDFSFNQILAMNESSTFRKNIRVRKLLLNNNMIHDIQVKAFKQMRMIEHLELQHNRITKLSGQLLYGYENLEYFDASYNHIERIAIKALQNNAALKVINLSHNQIKKIAKKQFYGLQNCELLDLSYNEIYQIHKDTFKGDESHHGDWQFKKLLLNNNLLPELSEKLLRKMGNLLEINLDDNLITTVSPSAFDKAPKLKYVYIRRNKIVTLDPRTFSKVPDLKIAFLSHNSLEDMPEEMLNDKEELHRVDLGDNPKLTNNGNLGNIFQGSTGNLLSAMMYKNGLENVDNNLFEDAPILSLIDVQENKLKSDKLTFIQKALANVDEQGKRVLDKVYLRDNNFDETGLNHNFGFSQYSKSVDDLDKLI